MKNLALFGLLTFFHQHALGETAPHYVNGRVDDLEMREREAILALPLSQVYKYDDLQKKIRHALASGTLNTLQTSDTSNDNNNADTVVRLAILLFSNYVMTLDNDYKRLFLTQIHWLKRNLRANDNGMLCWQTGFDEGSKRVYSFRTTGRCSARLQAEGLAALARAWAYTGDEAYIRLICDAFVIFQKGVSDGGFITHLPNGGIWLAEYSADKPAFVLHTFLYTMFGIYEIARLLPDRVSRKLGLSSYLEKLNTALRDKIHEFDVAINDAHWSRYDLLLKAPELIVRLMNLKNDDQGRVYEIVYENRDERHVLQVAGDHMNSGTSPLAIDESQHLSGRVDGDQYGAFWSRHFYPDACEEIFVKLYGSIQRPATGDARIRLRWRPQLEPDLAELTGSDLGILVLVHDGQEWREVGPLQSEKDSILAEAEYVLPEGVMAKLYSPSFKRLNVQKRYHALHIIQLLEWIKVWPQSADILLSFIERWQKRLPKLAGDDAIAPYLPAQLTQWAMYPETAPSVLISIKNLDPEELWHQEFNFNFCRQSKFLCPYVGQLVNYSELYEGKNGHADIKGIHARYWSVPGPAFSPPLLRHGLLYLGAGFSKDCQGTGVIMSIEPTDLAVRWRTAVEGAIGDTTIVEVNGRLISAAGDKLIGVDPKSGALLWEVPLADCAQESFIASADNVVYFGAGSDAWAINANGAPLWRHTLGGRIFGAPAMVDDKAVFADYGSTLTALRRSTGEIVWETELPGDGGAFAGPLLAMSSIYVADRGGYVSKFNEKGQLTASFYSGVSYIAGPILCGKHIVTANLDGRVDWLDPQNLISEKSLAIPSKYVFGTPRCMDHHVFVAGYGASMERSMVYVLKEGEIIKSWVLPGTFRSLASLLLDGGVVFAWSTELSGELDGYDAALFRIANHESE